eukprot:403343432
MFLGSFVMTIHFVQCYGSRLFPQLSINAIHWISAAISGLGILFEQPHKRVEITYYTLPKAFESFWNTLERRNYVMNIPYQEYFLFSFAVGIIAMSYNEGINTKTLRGFSQKACKYIWSETSIQSQKNTNRQEKVTDDNQQSSSYSHQSQK